MIDLTNKKMLKEWQKIEAAGIFDTLEEFAKYYYENGEKSCFRIITNDPWSKENFFFGTYQELLDFYKTDVSVSKAAKARIGEKFHYLTILDVFAENPNGKKVIYAKCKCDCGNETTVDYGGITKGNIRSCGCMATRGTAVVNRYLKNTRPDILKFWDYNKNTILDTEVTEKSIKSVWWKCEKCNQSFQQSVASFIRKKQCPNCDVTHVESILEHFPELVEDEWDYSKNEISPKDISVRSTAPIWWTPKYGESFQATIGERTKSSNGTSFEEQAIFYYVRHIFNDAVNRGRFFFEATGETELDIYIPSLHLAIEYDGAYWHKNKKEIDFNKNKALADAGAYLIRVRECGLEDVDVTFGKIIYRTVSSNDKGLHLQDVINCVMFEIKSYITDQNVAVEQSIIDSLERFHLSREKIIDDRPHIYAQYITAYQPNNIAKSCLIKYWDFKRNGKLLPQNVAVNSRLFVYLTCSRGMSFQVRLNNYFSSNEKPHIDCNKCFLNFCPFASEASISICPIADECDVYKKAISDSLYVPTWAKNKHRHVLSHLNHTPKEIPCTINLIKNTKDLYEKYNNEAWDKIYAVLETPDKINKSVITEWFNLLEPAAHIKLVYTLWKKGTEGHSNLIKTLKDFLHNSDFYCIRFFPIQINDSVPKQEIIKMFCDLSTKRFHFKLEMFDSLDIMKDFCESILVSCYDDEDFPQLNDLALTRFSEKELDDLTIAFSRYLYKLLCELEKAMYLPHVDSAKERLLAKLGEKSDVTDIIFENHPCKKCSTESFDSSSSKASEDDYIENEELDIEYDDEEEYTPSYAKPTTTRTYQNTQSYKKKFSKPENNFVNKKAIVIAVALILAFVILMVAISRCSSSQNGYVDLTKHKSIEFVINNGNESYTMERNLLRKPPDIIAIPETYDGKPVTIMKGNFSEYNITEVVGSKNLIKISNEAFADKSDISHMKLEKVIFPEDGNLESIERWAFFNNDKLHTVVVPHKFKSFGVGTFYSCDSLSALVIYNETPPSGAEGLFYDGYNQGFLNKPDVAFVVYVPDSAVSIYRNSAWGMYSIRPISEWNANQ